MDIALVIKKQSPIFDDVHFIAQVAITDNSVGDANYRRHIVVTKGERWKLIGTDGNRMHRVFIDLDMGDFCPFYQVVSCNQQTIVLQPVEWVDYPDTTEIEQEDRQHYTFLVLEAGGFKTKTDKQIDFSQKYSKIIRMIDPENTLNYTFIQPLLNGVWTLFFPRDSHGIVYGTSGNKHVYLKPMLA